MAGATTMHLIRHGSHDMLGRGLAGRLAGLHLDDSGRAEADAIAADLAKLPLTALVSSPLERALETATPVAARSGLPVRIDSDLNELDFGRWTGASFEALRDDPEWHAFNRFRSSAGIPGGETMLDAQARAIRAVRRIVREHAEGEVAIFCHADIVKAILAHFLGMPLDLLRRIEVAPASRSVLRLFDEDAVVIAVNLPPIA
jgi:probable phosphoglycerate mutase